MSENQKRQKLSVATPTKSVPSKRPISNNTDENGDTCDEDFLSLDTNCIDDIDATMFINEMAEVYPEMASYIQSTGRATSWYHFFSVVNDGKFPLENIALELFLDIADWCACGSVNARHDNIGSMLKQCHATSDMTLK